MADKIGELYVEIDANTKKFNKGIDSAKKGTEKFDKGLSGLSGTVKKLLGAGALIAVASKVADIGKAAINAASEAEETRAKFETAFRGIQDEADAVAKNLADNYGLSTTESENLLGATGDLIKGFGANATQALETSEEIQKLSVDLASYNNLQGGATQASEILTKAFLGERDSLVSLGIKVSEADVKQRLLEKGQQDLTGQALLLAKGNATLELAVGQSSDAIGDFSRTQDSFANKTRVAAAAVSNLSVEIGRSLLPSASTVTGIFGELTGKLAEYLKRVNDIRVAEKAQELGIATRQQEILLLNEQIKNNETLIEQEKQQLDLSEEQESITGKLAEANIDLIEQQNVGLARRLGELTKALTLEEQQLKLEEEREEQTKKQQAEEEKLRLERAEAYKQAVNEIESIIDGNKTQIELIDEEILALQNLTTADKESNDKRLEAVEILQAEKQRILDEEQKALDEANQTRLESILARFEAEKQAEIQREEEREETRQKRIDGLREEADFITSIAGSINQVWNNVNQSRINSIETEKKASIDALDEELLGTEEYNKQKKEIEKKAAEEAYNIRLAEFNTNKLLTLSQIAIDTAAGIAKAYGQTGIFGVSAAIPVAVAGAAQAAVVLSQPEPPRPQLATGAIVPGSQRGVDVTVGENNSDELILGGGAKGENILNRFADKINARGGGSNPIVINQNNMLNLSNEQGLDKAAELLFDRLEQVRLRRGAS